MNVEFTNRAVRDLREISDHTRRQFGDRVTTALEGRLSEAVMQIVREPEAITHDVWRCQTCLPISELVPPRQCAWGILGFDQPTLAT